jgi:hypothetical protein
MAMLPSFLDVVHLLGLVPFFKIFTVSKKKQFLLLLFTFPFNFILFFFAFEVLPILISCQHKFLFKPKESF